MILRNSQFSLLPEVVKNLLIINGLFFLGTWSLNESGIDLVKIFGLHQFQSKDFMPHQLITHMFMHADLTHLFFNMFTLWMFGKNLENMWGPKRFLIYYLITGFGAALIYIGYIQFQINNVSSLLNDNMIMQVMEANPGSHIYGTEEEVSLMGELWKLINGPMLGASGAVYGLLLAYGFLFPNTMIYLYFAIPIKTKYFVIGIGLLALIDGMANNPGDNIAHFAHLGGMIFGLLILRLWKKQNNLY